MKRKSLLIAGLAVGMVIFFILNGHGQQSGNYKKLVYDWYPASTTPVSAVLVIGGSEGGIGYGKSWARVLNGKGISVLDLAFFGKALLSGQLEEIPMEYFQRAWDTLSTLAGVNAKKLSIIAVSKGTEPALWLAAHNSNVSLVVAASPSHAIWQGINRANYSSVKSSWTLAGKPMPFIPYDYSRGTYPIVNFYLKGVESGTPAEALIPVEKIKGTVVLLAGGKDMIWPASAMTSALEKRYATVSGNKKLIVRNYPDAGHGFLLPFEGEAGKKKLMDALAPNLGFLGGDAAAFAQAMEESFQLVLEELTRH